MDKKAPMSPQAIWEIRERYIDQRFELVKIAFDRALANQAQQEKDIPAVPVAKAVVEYADAVLAAMDRIDDTAKQPRTGMEKPGEAENDDAK